MLLLYDIYMRVLISDCKGAGGGEKPSILRHNGPCWAYSATIFIARGLEEVATKYMYQNVPVLAFHGNKARR